MPINLSCFLGELMYKIMCIKDQMLMNGGEVVDERVYPLPLFVESLRRSMGVTQQELSYLYDSELNKAISALTEKVDEQLHKISNNNNRTKLGPKTKGLFNAPSRRKLDLYVQLRDTLDELEHLDCFISSAELEKCCKTLHDHIDGVTTPEAVGVGAANGGTEVRTIRMILNPFEEKHEEALKFILLNCFPLIMTETQRSNYIKRVLLLNKRNVLKCFFSYSENGKAPRYTLKDTGNINSIIEYIWSEKENLLYTDGKLSVEAQRDRKIDVFRKVFTGIIDMLIDVDLFPISSFCVKEEYVQQHARQSVKENPQIWLGERTKHDLGILLGATQMQYAWKDISSAVYDITKQAIMMTDRYFEDNPDLTEDKDDLLKSFFYYLLYSTQLIRETIARYRNSVQQKEQKNE